MKCQNYTTCGNNTYSSFVVCIECATAVRMGQLHGVLELVAHEPLHIPGAFKCTLCGLPTHEAGPHDKAGEVRRVFHETHMTCLSHALNRCSTLEARVADLEAHVRAVAGAFDC